MFVRDGYEPLLKSPESSGGMMNAHNGVVRQVCHRSFLPWVDLSHREWINTANSFSDRLTRDVVLKTASDQSGMSQEQMSGIRYSPGSALRWLEAFHAHVCLGMSALVSKAETTSQEMKCIWRFAPKARHGLPWATMGPVSAEPLSGAGASL